MATTRPETRPESRTGKHAAGKASKRHSRLRTHLVCIAVGAALTVVASFAPLGLAHIAPLVPILPSAVQELLDRIFSL